MNSASIFIFGLLWGSFLNVVISRLGSSHFTLGGRSFCPHCKHTIFWYDNIPLVSFMLLGGKCRHCRRQISYQYPAVELGSALLLWWLFNNYGFSWHWAIYGIVASFLVVIFVYDLKHYLILDRVSLPAAAVAFLGNIFLGQSFTDLALAAALGGGFFAAQYFISHGRWVGGGDIRLGILMGALLGVSGLLVALMLAYIVGALVGIFLMLFKKKTMSSQIPFGPFLVGGTLVSLVYSEPIINWYLNLL